MEFRIKNKELSAVIKLLDHLQLSGKGSVGRTDLKHILIDQNKALRDREVELVDNYNAWTNKEKNKYSLDNKELAEQVKDLKNNYLVLNFESHYDVDFIQKLESYEELSGIYADAYAILYKELVEDWRGSLWD